MYCILIKDDYSIYTKGIAEIIKNSIPNAYIEEVVTGADLLQKVILQHWHIIISDTDISDTNDPGKDNSFLLAQIRKFNPQTAVIVTTNVDITARTSAVESADTTVYLTKSCSEEDLIRAVENAVSTEAGYQQ